MKAPIDLGNLAIEKLVKCGGSAFPLTQEVSLAGQTCEISMPGMSLRDYFAAKAMAALLTNPAAISAFKRTADGRGLGINRLIATSAYESADAMLQVREESV